MSLPHALLTSLLELPCSGLDLASRFDRSIGHFWQATHQQIYKELGKLEEAGWVESAPAESGRGRRKLYRVLPAGKRELKRWIKDVQDPTPLRDGMMVRLRAEATLGPSGVEHDLRHRLEQHEKKLALYRQIETRDFSASAPSREQQLQHLVLQAGIMHESQWVAFCEKALKLLSEINDDKSTAPQQ